ncbi:MAG: hypothetical protein ACXWC9_01965 [Pseudobdellovibrionaceae bacterium]
MVHPNGKRKQRYRHVEGKRWVEVRIKESQQLFDARDPAPFRERDLDDDFVEYIVSSAQEFSNSTPLKIVIYIESKGAKEIEKESIQEAIRSYFIYQTERQSIALKNFVRRANIYLAIGILILFTCLGVAQGLTTTDQPGPAGILREGIVIFGWVSVWKPIELLLFDWFPLYEKLRLYRKISITELDIRMGDKQ